MSENKENIDFKYNLRVYFNFLKKYKAIFIIIAIISLIDAGIQITPRFLFKLIVDGGNEFFSNLITKDVYVQTLVIVMLVFAFVSILRVVLSWLEHHLINILDSSLMRDLKTKYFNHVLNLSYNFHTTHKTGSLISRLMRGSSSIERMTDIIVHNFLPLILRIVVVGGAIWFFSWSSALVTILTMVLFIVYSFYLQQLQKESSVIAIKTEDIEKGNVSDFFTNVDSIKHYGKEKSIEEKFKQLTEKTRLNWLKNWGYFRWLSSGQAFLLALGTFLVVYFSVIDFLNGNLTIGSLVFVYTSYQVLVGPLFGFVHGMRGFYRSMADFESLFRYGKIENEIRDKPNAKNLEIKKGEVEFENVSFRYNKKRGILDDFSLKIKKNKKIAFVGHSGSGKTTIVKLLYRLYDVDSGKITIDGINIGDVKQESLRSELSVVPQECVLFDDTIYNNIKFSNPSASREEIFKAMKFAQLDELIEKLPYKERTIVGERGVKLSGGEKQRVSIARAILADKKVLVLDEATSSLDSETENEIQKDLELLMRGRTTIIIAHRLSTIMKADLIVVLKNGKIIQQGTHKQLIRKRGEYKKLWNLQKGGYIK